MTLSNVNEVVYLKDDPGQYKVGDIMYRLTAPSDLKDKHSTPRPVPASQVGLTAFDQFNQAYETYLNKHKKPNLTSFLCTDAAYQILLSAEVALAEYKVLH